MSTVVNYVDMQFLNLVSESFQKQKVCKAILACSRWAQVKYFEQKIEVKILVALSL